MPRKTLKKLGDKVIKGKAKEKDREKKILAVKRVKLPVNVVNLKKENGNSPTHSTSSGQASSKRDAETEIESKKNAARKEKAEHQAEENVKIKRANPEFEQYFQYAREEKKKKIIMYSGISLIMLFVMVLWFFNLRYNLEQASLARESDTAEKYDIDKISEEFKKTMDVMSSELEKQQAAQNNLPANDLSASTSNDIVDIASLKARLEEKVNVASSTGVIASSTIVK